MVVRNKTTGKILYSCIKASGEFDLLYNKLLQVANRIFAEHKNHSGYYIYNYYCSHWIGTNRLKKLLCAYNTYYFEYSDCAYSYLYSIIKS